MKKHLYIFFIPLIFSFFVSIPNTNADTLSLSLRGDTIFLDGDPKLSYFSDNTLGPGYGFGINLEVFLIDFIFDTNFFHDGAQFNQLGLGFDIDLFPLSAIDLSPTTQLLYYFGKFDDQRESIKGLHGRAGIQLGVNFAKFFWLNAEAFGGYIITTPDVGAGFVYSGGVNLTAKFHLIKLFSDD